MFARRSPAQRGITFDAFCAQYNDELEQHRWREFLRFALGDEAFPWHESFSVIHEYVRRRAGSVEASRQLDNAWNEYTGSWCTDDDE